LRQFAKYLGLILKYPFQLFSGLVLTLFILLLLGINPSFQDFMGDRLAAFLSREYRTVVRIDQLQLRASGELFLNGVYIEDHYGDTLLFANKLKLRVRLRPILLQQLRISNIDIDGLYLRMIRKDYETAFNIDFLLPDPAEDDKIDSVLHLPVMVIEKMQLRNSRFTVHDYTKKQSIGQFNPNHLELTGLQLNLKQLDLQTDSSQVHIEKLIFREKKGLEVRDMGFSLHRYADQLLLDSLHLQTRASELNASVSFRYAQELDLLDFAERVRLLAKIERLQIDPEELRYLTGLDELPRERLYASGTISGRLSNLRSRDLKLRLGQENYINGQVNITGLPDFKGALYDLKISEAYLSRSGLNAALPFIAIPQQFDALEYIQLSADCFGYLEDFVAHGLFSTNVGALVTDLNLKLQGEEIVFSGELNADRLDMRALLKDDRYGQMRFQLKAKGSGSTMRNLVSEIAGKLDYADYSGYRYEGVELDGYLDQGLFTGRVASADTNANFDFFGVADLSDGEPFYNFVADIRRVDFQALKLTTDTMVVQGFVEICLEGTDRDSLEGEVNFRQLELDLNSRHLSLASIDLSATRRADSSRYLKLSLPFGEAQMEGKFSFRTLDQSIERYVQYYLNAEKAAALPLWPQNFNFSVNLHDAQPVSDFFFPGRYDLDSLEGYVIYDGLAHQSDISFNVPSFRLDSLRLKNVSFIGRSDSEELDVDLYVDSMFRNGKFIAHKLSAEQTLGNDLLNFDVRATGDSSYNKIALAGFVNTTRDSIKVGFRPSYIDLYGNRWQVNQKGDIWIKDSVTHIENFAFRQASQTISLQGKVSHRRSDSLYLEMVDVDLQQLNPILIAYETSMEGFANMSLRSSSILRKAAVFGTVRIDEFVLDGQPLGDVVLKSEYSTELNRADLLASVVDNSDTLVVIEGYLSQLDADQEIDIDIRLAHSPINALDKILKPAFDDVSGKATAVLNLKGRLDGPYLTGYADVEKARLRVDFLNQYYNVNKRLLFTKSAIDFNNAELTDDAGGVGTLSGAIFHDKFRKTRLKMRLDARNLLVLNTPGDYQSSYFGVGKITGYATFEGPLSLISINIVGSTDRGTNFSIPLDAESDRGITDFITFVNKSDSTEVNIGTQNLELSGIDLKMNLTVTPEAEVNIIFDRKTGDVIRGRGNAVIEVQVNTLGEISMFGNYTFASGDYTFTLANIANKRFRITEGSTIRWSGDPYDAQLNLNAVYRQRASVSPLLNAATLANLNSSRTNQYMNIDAYLKLTGSLLSPTIAFQLKVPSINENDPNDPVSATIRNINNDEQRLNNQVIALLVAGQFIPEDVAAGGFAANTGINSVSEVLSAQFSNLISPLFGNVNVGVNFRNNTLANQLTTTPTNAETLSDLNVAVNTTFFDNRVLIDGNFGNSSRNATQTLGGEVTVEYLVNADGSFRLKAFNRLDDRIIFSRDTNYRQGIGLSYTKNYNTGEELKNDATRWLQDRLLRRIPWAPDSWKGDF